MTWMSNEEVSEGSEVEEPKEVVDD